MLLFHLSLSFSTGWFCTTPKYILTKFRDAKIDLFDIIEKNMILCVLEISALGTTLMTVSLHIFIKTWQLYIR